MVPYCLDSARALQSVSLNIFRNQIFSMSSHIIVVGNEKGGSGKSITAMHVVIGLLRLGLKVASIDLDIRQGTLSRFIENRQKHNLKAGGHKLPMPEHFTTDAMPGIKWLDDLMADISKRFDAIVIDTAGSDSELSRRGHSYADTLMTPLNDSLIDLDILAHVDVETQKIANPSQYAEMVFEQKIIRAQRDGGSIDWIVLRNRLSNLDARNKRLVGNLLADLSRRVGFRVIAGFGERVIFRELFLKGITMMDLRDGDGEISLSMSHVAARHEVRNLINAINLPDMGV
jgi:chromosome partitioning protein